MQYRLEAKTYKSLRAKMNKRKNWIREVLHLIQHLLICSAIIYVDPLFDTMEAVERQLFHAVKHMVAENILSKEEKKKKNLC